MDRLCRKAAYTLALIGSSSLTSPAAAQSATIPTPPARAQVDERGVDLSSGRLQLSGVDLSIGGENTGLEHLRTWTNLLDSIDGYRMLLNEDDPTGNHVTVVIGQTSDGFALVSGAYVQDQANGSTLVTSPGGYTYTTRDGTQIFFDSYITPENTEYFGPVAAVATRITSPSGAIKTLSYRNDVYYTQVYYDPMGDMHEIYFRKIRLQSVTNNFGYQLKYSYASNGSASGIAWTYITGVTAINNAVEYCDPYADSCSLTHSWPSVTYSYPPTSSSVVDSTDPAGRVTRYTGAMNQLRIKRPLTAAGSDDLVYNFASTGGKIASVQVAGLGTWNYAYSTSGALLTTSVTDPLAHTRSVTTDTGVEQVVSQTDEDGKTTLFAHDTKGRVTKITAPENNSVEYTFDGRGNVTQTTAHPKPGSGMSDITISAYFDPACANPKTCNSPLWTRDAKSNQTDYTYDPNHGGVLTTTAPAGANGIRPQTRYSYATYQGFYKNAAGSIVASGTPVYMLAATASCQTTASCTGTADESKAALDYGPQSAGTGNNLSPSTISRGSGDGSLVAVTAMGYDDFGNLISTDGPLPGSADTTRIRYNAARQRVGIVSADPDGAGSLKHRAQRTTYDGNGNAALVEFGTVLDQSDSAWANFVSLQQLNTSYATSGLKARDVITAGGTTYGVTEYSYDALGRRDCTATRMNVAVWGTPLAACSPATTGADGPDRISKYSYDLVGRETTVRTGVGVSGQEVDELTTTYTPNGNVATRTDGEGNLTSYAYDGVDRLSKTSYPSPSVKGSVSASDYEQLTYDPNGNVTAIRQRDGSGIAFTYDSLDRLTFKDVPDAGRDVTYSYDLKGRLTSAARADTVTFGYDALDRQLSETQSFGAIASQYDLAGRRTRVTWNDGFYVDYDYLVTGEMSRVRESGASSGVGVLATYGYDDLGRRTSLVRGNGTTTSYVFNTGSQLTSIAQDLSGTTKDLTLGLSYNPAGQIKQTTRSNDLYAWTGHYNTARPYTTNGLNQYTASGPISLAYDGRGNLITSGADSYTYWSENQLKTKSGGISFYYDTMDRLVEYDTSTSTRMVYDGDQLVSEVSNPGGSVLRRYVHGASADEPLVWYEGAGTADRRWLHADEKGSVIAVTDVAGSALATNSYDEYGIPADTNLGRFQYTGQTWLPEAGLYNYKARIYSPSLGRFMQTDPIGYGDGMNLYAYVGNDPVNGRDSSGTQDDIVVTGSRGSLGGVAIPGLTGGGSPPPNLFATVNITNWIVVKGKRQGTRRVGTGTMTVLNVNSAQNGKCPAGTSADTKGKPDYTGVATMYGETIKGKPDRFAGQLTANGEKMNPDAMTAASVRLRDSKGGLQRAPLIRMGTTLVVSLVDDPNTSIVVRVNDTGPLRPGRILDLTPAAMKALTGKAYNETAVNAYICK